MKRPSFIARLVAIAATLSLSACCRISEREDRNRGPDVDSKPAPSDVELGIGAFPAATPTSKAALYRFLVPPLNPPIYRTGYALGEEERRAIRDAHRGYASSVGYTQQDDKRFSWQPPPGCNKDMHCVLDALASRNMPAIRPLAERFKQRAKTAKLNTLEAAELVVSFVQSIPYQIPKEPFGLLPPALVVAEKRGDCDSKSLLGLLILKVLGIESVIVESDTHHHAMLGIPLPAQGSSFEYKGRRYAFTETTAKGWPIGQIDPRLLRPNDWRPIAVRTDAKPSPTKQNQGTPGGERQNRRRRRR